MSKHTREPNRHPDPSLGAATLEVMRRLADRYGSVNWHPSGKPVDELVVTILSQNTADLNTDRAFAALRERFSNWHDVRDAPLDDLVATIRSAGLAAQKGAAIQSSLREILGESDEDANPLLMDKLNDLGHDRAMEYLTSLPGVGPKTAACVLLFAVGLPAIPVDTHVHRVSTRLGFLSERTSAASAHFVLRSIVRDEYAYRYHVYLIRHGREVCKSRRPRCEICILKDLCLYRSRNPEI